MNTAEKLYIEDVCFPAQTMSGRILDQTLQELPAVDTNIVQKLDRVSILRDGLASIQAERQSFIDSILSSYHHRIAAWDADVEAASAMLGEVEADAKSEVLRLGHTVKGATMQAVWQKGRVSWSSEMLEGMIAVIPEIGKAKKIGDPSVTLRLVKS